MTLPARPLSSSIPVQRWVKDVSTLTTPDRVVYCDGSLRERNQLISECLQAGELVALNQHTHPGCHLHRSAPHDVARTEHLTFVCTGREEDAGPNNNWLSPSEARARLAPLYAGAMKGRTMFVVPFLMGPPGSRFAQVGVQITDSRYVVLSMRIMTRIGQVALDHLGTSSDCALCLHSLGDLSPARRFIAHFPEEYTVWSIGSGYGGNALLAKKCLALRLASWRARNEGWLAEHMLILGLQKGRGNVRYIAAALPSGCGKTNLAMLVPPPSMAGWRTWIIGDDIAWLRPGPDGRLWAVNPEAGFFGIVPGTSRRTNPTAFQMIQRETIYTNVALRPDGTPWWEGHDDPPPPEALDWRGQPWSPASKTRAAHPNSRYTTSVAQCASVSPEFRSPTGVPIDAILFGSRGERHVPLALQSRDWQHGTFLGATLSSETTAASTGQVGRLRPDPMAMRPFCGYAMGDYFAHWLAMGRALPAPPKIFRVNWLRTDERGRFLWPGFGDNLRVLQWILERCDGRGEAIETPVGNVPAPNAIDRAGTDVSDDAMDALLKVDPAAWIRPIVDQDHYLNALGNRVPGDIRAEHTRLASAIRTAIK